MGGDQAAGLRHWATGAAQDECPEHVVQALVELATAQGSAASRPVVPAPAVPRPAVVPPVPVINSKDGMALMVLGLPGTAARHTARVTELLESWAQAGRRWVGDPHAWHVVALPLGSPHLPLLVAQQPRWALWIDDDPEAFRRGYRMLKQIAEQGGPGRLIAVHPPGLGREGLLNNLQYVAQAYFGIDLLVMT